MVSHRGHEYREVIRPQMLTRDAQIVTKTKWCSLIENVTTLSRFGMNFLVRIWIRMNVENFQMRWLKKKNSLNIKMILIHGNFFSWINRIDWIIVKQLSSHRLSLKILWSHEHNIPASKSKRARFGSIKNFQRCARRAVRKKRGKKQETALGPHFSTTHCFYRGYIGTTGRADSARAGDELTPGKKAPACDAIDKRPNVTRLVKRIGWKLGRVKKKCGERYGKFCSRTIRR